MARLSCGGVTAVVGAELVQILGVAERSLVKVGRILDFVLRAIDEDGLAIEIDVA
jgi:hypothetical protein